MLHSVKMKAATAFWNDVFSPEEIEQIKEFVFTNITPVNGIIGAGEGNLDTTYRRSNVYWLDRNQHQYLEWVFQRMDAVAVKLNTEFFGFDIEHIQQLQFTEYDSSDQGCYDWHWDMHMNENPLNGIGWQQQRKLTLVTQMTSPEEYEGGDLEVAVCGMASTLNKQQGLTVAFPSFLPHRVTPVTSGKRHSLVAWFTGPDWK